MAPMSSSFHTPGQLSRNGNDSLQISWWEHQGEDQGHMNRRCGYEETLYTYKISLGLPSYSGPKNSSVPIPSMPAYVSSPKSPTPAFITVALILNTGKRCQGEI